MAPRDALSAALALMKDPVSVRAMRRGALPPDVSALLAVAVGEPEAVARARSRTGYTDDVLEAAAAFFIEQILLDRRADSYRVLGGTSAATHAELRHNMALLMRWLHPDRHAARSGLEQDREIFAARVSRAWENLKSDDRRAAYERARAGGQSEPVVRRGPPAKPANAAPAVARGLPGAGPAGSVPLRRWPTLADWGRPAGGQGVRSGGGTFLERLLGLFRSRP
ncbi:MAG: hypothetical protein AB1592_05090 [Pseudomonadota bacterium]